MLKEIFQNYKDNDVLIVKASGGVPSSLEFKNEKEKQEYVDWVESDYNLRVSEIGDNSLAEGFIIVEGTKHNINRLFGCLWEDDFIQIIKEIKLN